MGINDLFGRGDVVDDGHFFEAVDPLCFVLDVIEQVDHLGEWSVENRVTTDGDKRAVFDLHGVDFDALAAFDQLPFPFELGTGVRTPKDDA